MFTTISLNTTSPNIFVFNGNLLTNSQSNIYINNFIKNDSNIIVKNNAINRNLINTGNIYDFSNIFSGNLIGNLYTSTNANIYNNVYLSGNISLNNANISNLTISNNTILKSGIFQKVTVNGNLNVNNLSMNPLYSFNLLPVGSVLMYAGITLPTGWLLCDGTTFSSVTYPSLFTLLGSTTLPNLQEKFIRGNASSIIGTTGGASNIVLQPSNLPSHNHNTDTLQVSHKHGITFPSATFGNDVFGGGSNEGDGSAVSDTNQTNFAIGGTTSIEAPVFNGNIGSAGLSNSLSILPPYISIKYIIKGV